MYDNKSNDKGLKAIPGGHLNQSGNLKISNFVFWEKTTNLQM